MTEYKKDPQELPESPERRALLAKAGRYAAATPAAVLVLLSTAKDAEATGIFKSGGGPGLKNGHYKKQQKRQWRRWHRKWHRKNQRHW